MADYPRSWNDDCPPITAREARRNRINEGAGLGLVTLFYAYIVIAFLLQGGCIADEPSSGLDIPPGCQCVEPLEELDRRLRAVEGELPTGTFKVPEGALAIPEGATLIVAVTYREGDWWLVWKVEYQEYDSTEDRVQTFGIPYPTSLGPSTFAIGPSGPRPPFPDPTWALDTALDDESPWDILELGGGRVVLRTRCRAWSQVDGWEFDLPLLPIPTSPMVTE